MSSPVKVFNAFVTNGNFTKSAVITANDFVDFKRKASSELELTGWLKVIVHKGKRVEGKKRLSLYCKEITSSHFSFQTLRILIKEVLLFQLNLFPT